jgi:hypothetical protein
MIILLQLCSLVKGNNSFLIGYQFWIWRYLEIDIELYYRLGFIYNPKQEMYMVAWLTPAMPAATRLGAILDKAGGIGVYSPPNIMFELLLAYFVLFYL